MFKNRNGKRAKKIVTWAYVRNSQDRMNLKTMLILEEVDGLAEIGKHENFFCLFFLKRDLSGELL